MNKQRAMEIIKELSKHKYLGFVLPEEKAAFDFLIAEYEADLRKDF